MRKWFSVVWVIVVAAIATSVASRGVASPDKEPMAIADTGWVSMSSNSLFSGGDVDGLLRADEDAEVRGEEIDVAQQNAETPASCYDCDASPGFPLVESTPGVDIPHARYTEIERWAIDNPQLALEWVTTIAGSDERAAFELLIVHVLLPLDPDLVFLYRDYLTQSGSVSAVDRAYARRLSETDVYSAFDWALAIEDPDSRLSALSVVSVQWVLSGEIGLLDRIAMLDNKAHARHLFASVAQIIGSDLAASDPIAALNWLETLTLDQQQTAMPSIFASWLTKDSLSARAWLYQQVFTPAKSLMIDHDFWYSLNHDLDHAMATFEELTLLQTAHSAHVYALVSEVSRVRPGATETLVQSLSGEHSKSATDAMDDQLMHADPQAYLRMYESLDSDRKVRHLVNILAVLRSNHPELVSQWLASAAISEAELAKAEGLMAEYVGC